MQVLMLEVQKGCNGDVDPNTLAQPPEQRVRITEDALYMQLSDPS